VVAYPEQRSTRTPQTYTLFLLAESKIPRIDTSNTAKAITKTYNKAATIPVKGRGQANRTRRAVERIARVHDAQQAANATED